MNAHRAGDLRTRTERDSFGRIEVPLAALWGAQTERSRQFFAIGEQRMPLVLVHALAQLKRAAAEVNAELGLLEADRARAIAAAAAQVAEGRFDDAFPLSVWQTGSGTQTNMNMNEVLGHLADADLDTVAVAALAKPVHPNDEVNRGQSSNDVMPSALHVAAVLAAQPLLVALAQLQQALLDKAQEFAAHIKVGRTHLQDAVPITLGQEFGSYAAQLAMADAAVRHALPPVCALAIGGTAVGTGLNTHAEFGARVAQVLAQRLAQPFVVAANPFAALAGREALVGLHAALRLLAIALIKIGSDIRLMGSGPHAGLGELRLPANEAGSSMMPGKVNPTQIEALNMVCLQVMGHDVALGMAAALGQFELNVCLPLIALNLLDSLRLLGDGMHSFTVHCVQGLQADTARLQSLLDGSAVCVTALVPHIGYDRAAAIAQHARQHALSLRTAALGFGGIAAADYERWADPRRMLGPGPGPPTAGALQPTVP